MMRPLQLLAAVVVMATAVSSAAAADRIKLVASFSILGDMVRQVAGDHAEIATIVGPDADAHVYQPTAGDAKAVAAADVIIVNGLGFETWSQTLIDASGSRAPVIVATTGIEPLRVDGAIDPHAWNALPNGMIYVDAIAAGLAAADPANAAAYRANAATYRAALATLHRHALDRLSALPATRRTVVTAHDAFGYLARAYGLTVLAPVGIDTDAEPSAHDLARLIAQLRDAGAAALFVENISSPALVRQIARETGIEIGGRLYSDALSARGGPATSYRALFEHNLNILISALQPQS